MLSRKIERLRVKPSRPTVGEIATNATRPTARGVQLAERDEDFTVREMSKAAIVVHVQMRQHNFLHFARSDPESSQLRSNLLLALNPERDFPSDIRMQRLAGFEKVRALTGVDHNDAIAMLDSPRIGREPFGPVAIGKDGQPPRQAVATPFDLRRLVPNEAGLNGVYVHSWYRSEGL